MATIRAKGGRGCKFKRRWAIAGVAVPPLQLIADQLGEDIALANHLFRRELS